jgi:hypothetical protein
VVIPCASDSDSGSVDLQLSDLEDIKKIPSNNELTGEKGKGLIKKVGGEFLCLSVSLSLFLFLSGAKD